MHPSVLKQIVPSANNNVIVFKKKYDTMDIIELIKKSLPMARLQTVKLARKLRGATEEQTKRNIFKFLKTIRYEIDPEGTQVVPLPSKVLTDNKTDCKGLSILTHGLLFNNNIDHAIRFAKYKNSDQPNEYTHVYCIAPVKNGYITIDAVADSYNMEFPNMNPSPLDINFIMKPNSSINGKPSYIGFRVNNPFKFLAEQYNDSKLKDTLSDAQNSVKAKTDQFVGWVKEKSKDIENAASKALDLFKTAIGAPGRGAYLALLNLNFRGWASLWNYGRMTEEEQAAKGLSPVFAASIKGAYNAFSSKWVKLGGNRTELNNILRLGATRKPILGKNNAAIKGIGEVTLASILGIISVAAPVVAMVSGIIGDIVKDNKGKMPPELKDTDDGSDIDEKGNIKSDNTMVYVLGGGLALFGVAYYYNKTKKKNGK